MRVAETGLTMAEYFREETHKDVLLFIDNIFRFVQAGSEVSALMGRMPSAVAVSYTHLIPVRKIQIHGGPFPAVNPHYGSSFRKRQDKDCLLYTSRCV